MAWESAIVWSQILQTVKSVWAVSKTGSAARTSSMPDGDFWWDDETDASALFEEPDLVDDGEDE